VRASQEQISAPTIGRESAGEGVVAEGVKKSNKSSKLPKMYKNGVKTAGFTRFFTYKRRKYRFLLKSTEQNILLMHFLRNTFISNFFVTLGVVELYLFNFSEVIYTPSHPD
jgi:hypothetical protein